MSEIDEDLVQWVRGDNGERALSNLDEGIRVLKNAHERALRQAVRQVLFSTFDNGESLHAIGAFRQSIAASMLIRERIVKLIERAKEQP